MRHSRRIHPLGLLGLLLLLPLQADNPFALGGDSSGYFRMVRAIKTQELETPNPAGVAFSPEANAFLLLQAGRPDRIALMSPFGEPMGSVAIGATVPDPINVAWDRRAGRLLSLGATGDELIELALASGASPPHSSTPSGLPWSLPRSAQGMTVDPETGTIFVLDGAARRVVRLEPDGLPGLERETALRRGRVSFIWLTHLPSADLRGIAFNPSDGHLSLLSPTERRLYELTLTGEVVATRDLSSSEDFKLTDPQGMVFAPSGDRTDDPAQTSLYIADSRLGDPWQRTGQVLELSFTRLELSPEVMAAPTVQPTLVRTINTAAWSTPSPDPMDIGYLPGSNHLLVADSEIEESPQVYWHGFNLFEATLTGSLVATHTTYTATPLSLVRNNFSREPTGMKYNPLNGHWVFSDDDDYQIFDVNLGGDGVYGTADDTVKSFLTKPCGDYDPESVAVDSGRGHLILVEGADSAHHIVDIAPGANGIFDGCVPPADDVTARWDTSGFGIADPEAVEYNPERGTLFISGHGATTVIETSVTGTLLTVYNISSMNINNPSGLVYAPSSVNPAVKDLYISARGVDNDSDPNENDGKVYEISLGTSTCGNGVREGSEACDGTDLGGVTCASRNCTGGTPRCLSGCVLDYSTCTGCPVCGNGIKETGEVCDGSALGGQTCQSQGFNNGTLRCLSSCSGFDTSLCSNPNSLEVRVAASSDDAEQSASGSMSLSSSDLELVYDGSNQTIGMRFPGIVLPRGTSISNAYVQFKVDEVQSEPTTLTIQGEAADNPVTFPTTSGNISTRPRTLASVSWGPIPAWNTLDAVGLDQRTPNLAPIIQEILNRTNWTSGNALALIISGTGHRTAKAWDGDPAGAPLLHLEIAASAVCGNGTREGSEQCDGADLGGASCSSQGCSGGTPRCTSSCVLDYSTCTGCSVCGNGVREAGEQCDGADLGGAACSDRSCTSGTPRCSSTCTLDYSTCTVCCGNGIREGSEQCDGTDLGGATCASQSCTGGTPRCSSTCTLDYSTCTGCPVCGNGIREGGEVCDGSDLGGQTCQTRGFGSGTLQCLSNCSGFDTALCSVCDLDGRCDAGEDCQKCPNECIHSSPTCGNDVCETGNGEDCRSCPADCNGLQGGKPSRRYCCGDGDGTNPVGCGDLRCTASGNTCAATPTPVYCCGNLSCEGGETATSCSIDCGP